MSDEKLELEKVSPRDDAHPERPTYPRAVAYSSYGYGYGGYGSGGEQVHLRELWRTVRKRRLLIVVIAAIVTSLVTIEMYRTKSIYQASTTLEMGKDGTMVLKSGDLVLEADDFDMRTEIKTKMLVLKSRPLLENVIINLKLDQNPKFLSVTQRRSFWEALDRITGKKNANDQAEAQPSAESLDSLDQSSSMPSDSQAVRPPQERARLKPFVKVIEDNLNVEQVRDTRALTVTYTHTDPEIAAAVVSGIVQDFIQRTFQAKTEKFTNTSEWLDRSTRELKAKVEQAEQALANYSREHNIFSTDGKETLTTDKLARLHDQVMRAETDRILKQSLYEEVRQGRVAQLPDAFADPKAVALQTKLGDLGTLAAQLSVKYGPENPKVVEVQEQMAAVQQQLDASSKMLEEKLRADYERAVRDEASLKSALERAKAEAVQQNQDAIQYNILRQDVDTSKSLYTDFLQKTNQAQAQVAEQHNSIRVIEPAQTPTEPIGPRRLLTILISFFFGFGGGVGLAFFLEYLDNTIKSVEDVNRYTQLPALGVIPTINASQSKRLSGKNGKQKSIAGGRAALLDRMQPGQLMTLDNRSSAAEAYRVLRTSVLLSAAGNPPKTILVTSSQPGEGKTTTVINTAISLAQLGASVLVIDCDLRKPTAHKVLGADNTIGLSTYLSRTVDIDRVIQNLQIPNMSLLSCGPIPPNPAELLSSAKMKNMLQTLAERYDHILIDSPPLINVADPVILSTLVDGVMLVVYGGKSTRDVARRSRQELAGVGAKIFGVVLNNVDLRSEGYDNYYYYGGYGRESAETSSLA